MVVVVVVVVVLDGTLVRVSVVVSVVHQCLVVGGGVALLHLPVPGFGPLHFLQTLPHCVLHCVGHHFDVADPQLRLVDGFP